MSKIKLELNSEGVREMLKWDETRAVCMEHANRVRNNCGNGYVVQSRTYRERSGAAVFADTPEAYRDNLKNETLLRALK